MQPTIIAILDEDRKINAQKFEASFYSNPDLRTVRAPQEQKNFSQPQVPQATSDFATLLLQLQQKPELISSLAALIRG